MAPLRGGKIAPPVPLTIAHSLGPFSCGKEALDDWLKNTAMRAEGRTARTYVVCDGPNVVGYYCLATGAVVRDELPKKLRKDVPSTVPTMIIGRLAVSSGHQGLGIGKGLLKDALLRIASAAEHVGARAVMVHAIDDAASKFYADFGFLPFPAGSRTLFLPIDTITG